MVNDYAQSIAYRAGRAAYLNNDPLDSNPYRNGDQTGSLGLFQAWELGWREARGAAS